VGGKKIEGLKFKRSKSEKAFTKKAGGGSFGPFKKGRDVLFGGKPN